MSKVFNVLVDDQDPQVNYLCPTINQKVPGSFSNHTWSTIESQSCKDGWFEYAFHGTGIKVDIPTKLPAEALPVTLDGNPLSPQPDGSFEATGLDDGPHSLKYAIGNVKQAPVFDYLTVTAGPSTPLNGRTLIVDDAELAFSGNWSSTPPHALRYDYSTRLYRDTAQWSSTVGDTMSFEFTGSSVSVYGLVLNVTSSRSLTATYTLDGVTQTRPVPKGTLNALPMVELFHASDLTGGRHTLRVNVTDVAYPQTLGIDFVSYNSSVDSITSLPGFQPTANAAPIGASGSGRKVNPGEIAGIVAGTLAILALFGVAIYFWRRSRHASKTQQHAIVFNTNSSYDDLASIKREL